MQALQGTHDTAVKAEPDADDVVMKDEETDVPMELTADDIVVKQENAPTQRKIIFFALGISIHFLTLLKPGWFRRDCCRHMRHI